MASKTPSVDQSLIGVAAKTLSTVPPNDVNHTVAAAARSRSGQAYVGVNVFHFSGGPCAELVVLGNAAGAGVLATDLTTMVAVKRDGATGVIGVVNPCGRCRQVLLDYNADINVIVRDASEAEERAVAVRELLPFAYVWENETSAEERRNKKGVDG
jgi:cytidine deaminase